MIKANLDAAFMGKDTFRANVEAIISEYKKNVKTLEASLKQGERLKSSPALKLREEGKLNLTFFLAEFEKIANKQSKLPRGQREVICQIIFDAARRTVVEEQKAKQIAELEAQAAQEENNEQTKN